MFCVTFTTLGGGLADEFFGEYRVGVCCFSHQLCSDFSHKYGQNTVVWNASTALCCVLLHDSTQHMAVEASQTVVLFAILNGEWLR